MTRNGFLRSWEVSMSWAVTAAVAAVATAASTGYSIYSGERANDAQQKAQQKAKKAALTAEKQQDTQIGQANQKRPDTMAILAAAQQNAASGLSGTMLTGPNGLGAGALQLGKKSLLGS